MVSDKICLGAEALSHTLSSLSHFGRKPGQSSTWMLIQQQVGAYTVGSPVHSQGEPGSFSSCRSDVCGFEVAIDFSVYCVKNGALEGIDSCFQKIFSSFLYFVL